MKQDHDLIDSEGQGRTRRQLERDMKMGSVAGFMLGAWIVIVAFAFAMTWRMH